MEIYNPKISPLLRVGSRNIAGSLDLGADLRIGGSPARNLVMLAAIAGCLCRNSEDQLHIVLNGNNLVEGAVAYLSVMDPRFINRFNDLLPFAVGIGLGVKIYRFCR